MMIFLKAQIRRGKRDTHHNSFWDTMDSEAYKTALSRLLYLNPGRFSESESYSYSFKTGRFLFVCSGTHFVDQAWP